MKLVSIHDFGLFRLFLFLANIQHYPSAICEDPNCFSFVMSLAVVATGVTEDLRKLHYYDCSSCL